MSSVICPTAGAGEAAVRNAAKRGWVVIHKDRCTGCWLCVIACPLRLLEPSEHASEAGRRTVRFKGGACRADGRCRRACPEKAAITIHRDEPSAQAAR
jgi:2-oxoglutarate ferredoxin oxidoreductase subunit delta